MRWMTWRSGPKIFTASVVRTPVESMSVRFLIGIVQVLTAPVKRSVRSISAMSRSWVIPGRHSDSGFRLMTVSTIDSGAQSVAVFARPAFPHTDVTSEGHENAVLHLQQAPLRGQRNRGQ